VAERYDLSHEITVDSLTIEPDNFLLSETFNSYKEFQRMVENLKKEPESISPPEIYHLISLNPEYYLSYERIGDYFANTGDLKKSAEYYNFALSKELSSATERRNIIKKLSELNRDSGN
jgi:tetratricopeptide (TPR) repeat protein